MKVNLREVAKAHLRHVTKAHLNQLLNYTLDRLLKPTSDRLLKSIWNSYQSPPQTGCCCWWPRFASGCSPPPQGWRCSAAGTPPQPEALPSPWKGMPATSQSTAWPGFHMHAHAAGDGGCVQTMCSEMVHTACWCTNICGCIQNLKPQRCLHAWKYSAHWVSLWRWNVAARVAGELKMVQYTNCL